MKKIILTTTILFIGLVSNSQNYNLSFNGISDHVDLGTTMGNGIRTISMWFKPDTTIDSTINSYIPLIFRNDNSEFHEFGLTFSPASGNKGKLAFGRRINGQSHTIYSDNNLWLKDQWYHVFGTIDPVSGMKLYIDCVLHSQTNSSTAPTGTSTEITTIAQWGNYTPRNFYGEIDEVSLWTSAFPDMCSLKCNISNINAHPTLKGYWKMDEGSGLLTENLVTSQFDNVIGANFILSTPPCVETNYALSFNGINDHLDLGTTMGNGIRTISMWFKPDTTIDSTINSYIPLIFRNDNSEFHEFGLTFSPASGNRGKLAFGRRINGQSHTIYSDNNLWLEDQWYHVFGTIDPVSGMNLYIDCVLQSQTNASTAPTGTSTEITAIAQWGNYTPRNFHGEIDEVSLWTSSLSATDGCNLQCNIDNIPNQTNLQGYWRMNEGSGTITQNLATNQFNNITGANFVLNPGLCVGYKPTNETNTNSILSEQEEQVRIYPNPSESSVIIEFNNSTTKNVKLFNTLGMEVKNYSNIKDLLIIKRGNLENGIYFIKTIDLKTNNTSTKKLIFK